eukprot:TRINITY_DN5152_c0_g1_i20.p1 TRINITY_DN5152_c0_g1~~TRINITY_DN5152_c0_g1_i20.p1  ORF type:complete len:539 (+),score=96.29 TRINITY_DN5152_c0_g1_i20:105-1721(+)
MYFTPNVYSNLSVPIQYSPINGAGRKMPLTAKTKGLNKVIPSFRHFIELHTGKHLKGKDTVRSLLSQIIPNYSINDYLPKDSGSKNLSNKTLQRVRNIKDFPTLQEENAYGHSHAQYGPETTRLLQDSDDSPSEIMRTDFPSTSSSEFTYCVDSYYEQPSDERTHKECVAIQVSPPRLFTNTGIQTSIDFTQSSRQSISSSEHSEDSSQALVDSILRANRLKHHFNAAFKPARAKKESQELSGTSQFANVEGRCERKISCETDMSNINLVTESISTENRNKFPYQSPSKLASVENSKSEGEELVEQRQMKPEAETKLCLGVIPSFRPLASSEYNLPGACLQLGSGAKVQSSVTETAAFNSPFQSSQRNRSVRSSGRGREARGGERYSQRAEEGRAGKVCVHQTQFSAIEEEASELSKLETSKVSLNHTKFGSELSEGFNLLSKAKGDSFDYTNFDAKVQQPSYEDMQSSGIGPLSDMTINSVNKHMYLKRYNTEDTYEKNNANVSAGHSFSIGVTKSIRSVSESCDSIGNDENIDPVF